MSNPIYPCSVHTVSDSFQDHVDRGSVNPGTDYTAKTGTPVYAIKSGVIKVTDDNPSGSGGKMICIYFDDGGSADYLHLSGISVGVGQHVAQGELLGYSGNTGDPVGGGVYGAHLHISYRPHNQINYFANVGNVDLDAILRSQGTDPAGGGSTPIEQEEEEDMSTTPYVAENKPQTGLAVPGWTYLRDDATGIFRALSTLETEAYAQAHPQTWARRVSYAPADLDKEFQRTGIREYTGNQDTGPRGLTGRIIGGSADRNNEDGSGDMTRYFPYTQNPANTQPI